MLATVGPLAAEEPDAAPLLPPEAGLSPPLLPQPMSAAPASPAPTATELPRKRRRDTDERVLVQYP